MATFPALSEPRRPSERLTRAPLLRRLHRDQRGAVSLETLLVVGAVALPILIFILKFGWPRIRDYFSRNLQSLNNESSSVSGQ